MVWQVYVPRFTADFMPEQKRWEKKSSSLWRWDVIALVFPWSMDRKISPEGISALVRSGLGAWGTRWSSGKRVGWMLICTQSQSYWIISGTRGLPWNVMRHSEDDGFPRALRLNRKWSSHSSSFLTAMCRLQLSNKHCWYKQKAVVGCYSKSAFIVSVAEQQFHRCVLTLPIQPPS